MKRILWCVPLALALFETPSPAGAIGPPVGVWDAKAPARGQLAFNFSPDQTFVSYGMTVDSGGLFLVTGTWNVVGTDLSGAFQQVDPLITNIFTFTGSASATRLKLVVNGPGPKFRIKCTPLATPPDVTGDWNVETVKGPNITSSISITDSNGLPRVFMISDTTVDGVMMVDAKGKALAFVESGAVEADFRGKFDATGMSARFKGHDQSGKPIQWKLEALP